MKNGTAVVKRITGVFCVAVALPVAAARAGESEDLSRTLEVRAFLKSATGRVQDVDGGRHQAFEGGDVYATPERDYFAVEGGRNPILARYAALGGPTGRLGFPIEEAPAPGSGLFPRTQRFQNGSITAVNGTTTTVTVWEVPAPDAFFIRRSDTFPTTVELNWRNKGAPETLVLRKVNGGAWATIQSYGGLDNSTFSEWVDESPAADALNCYIVVGSDGFYTAATPTRCAYTRDGLSDAEYRVRRAQVRIKVPASDPAFGLGTDGAVLVRLQGRTNLNLALPTGNQTWVDSSNDDFEPGTNRRYDLMTRNISYVSDITMLSVTVPGGDDLCIEELELLINNRSVFRRFYGSTPTTCARTANGSSVVAASFDDLRASSRWPNGSTVTLPPVLGFRATDLRSLIEAKFANLLHDQDAHLRNGYPVTLLRLDDEAVWARVEFVAADGGILGDINCTADFRLVIHPSEAGDGRYRIRVEDADAECGWDWLPLVDGLVNLAFTVVPIWHYAVDVEVEKALGNAGGADLGVPPLPGTRFCFPSDTSGALFQGYEDGGFTLCNGTAP